MLKRMRHHQTKNLTMEEFDPRPSVLAAGERYDGVHAFGQQVDGVAVAHARLDSIRIEALHVNTHEKYNTYANAHVNVKAE